MDLSNLTYEIAGVSITAQNKVNAEVIKRTKAQGLFGGAVDVSKFKGGKAFLDITGCSISYSTEGIKESGKLTTEQAIGLAKGYPIGVLDYIAVPVMNDIVIDFVEGVVSASPDKKIVVIGGESAEMKDTYKENKLDAFVHALSIRNDNGCDITDLINKMEQPLVVASTDGTGTKTKIVRNPEDIIYHGFNDVGALGAKPVAFALYIAGNVEYDEMVEIDKKAENISKNLGVKKLESIITKKTEDYLKNEVDIAGTVVGVIDKKDLITGSNVKEGDVIIGINVDGLMTNGYTLARRVCDELIKAGKVMNWDDPVEMSEIATRNLLALARSKRAISEHAQKHAPCFSTGSVFDKLGRKSFKYELSRPHRPMTDILFGYENIEGILSKYKGHIKGMAHITGGGQEDNIIRTVPDNCKAIVSKYVLPIPLFMQLCKKVSIQEEELFKTFNMGVGFTITASKDSAQDIIEYINSNFRNRINDVDRQAAQIGIIESRKPSESKFEFIYNKK